MELTQAIALLDLPVVAEELSVSVSTVKRLLREGQLASVLVARRCRRVPRSEVNRYVSERLATQA